MQTEQTGLHAAVAYVAGTGTRLVVIEPSEGMGRHRQNFSHEQRRVAVANARLVSESPTLDREGFALVDHETSFRDFDTPEQIKALYYPEIERLLCAESGAARVLAFDHNVRIADGTRAQLRGQREPSRSVHNDYTEASAWTRAEDLLSAAESDTALEGRFAFINAWRPLKGPVLNAHLAICDARSVPRDSLRKAELRYADRVGEIYYFAFHRDHRWFYYPRMTPHEVLLLKVYDSADDGRASITPHTAIEDPDAPADAPARESIEVRTIALFP